MLVEDEGAHLRLRAVSPLAGPVDPAGPRPESLLQRRGAACSWTQAKAGTSDRRGSPSLRDRGLDAPAQRENLEPHRMVRRESAGLLHRAQRPLALLGAFAIDGRAARPRSGSCCVARDAGKRSVFGFSTFTRSPSRNGGTQREPVGGLPKGGCGEVAAEYVLVVRWARPGEVRPLSPSQGREREIAPVNGPGPDAPSTRVLRALRRVKTRFLAVRGVVREAAVAVASVTSGGSRGCWPHALAPLIDRRGEGLPRIFRPSSGLRAPGHGRLTRGATRRPTAP